MTPIQIPEKSLVIPAYNEENRITLFFDSITGFDGELIVVCDGTDQTADIVDTIAAQTPDLTIRCLRFDHRLGKGGGVIAGLKEARAPFVGYVDADGSTSMEEMVRLFSSLPRADGAIGSRWVAGSTLTVKQGFMRQLESRGFNLLIRILFGLTYHDTQCGAKVFTKRAIDTVLPDMVSTGFRVRCGTALAAQESRVSSHGSPHRVAEQGRFPRAEAGYAPDACRSFQDPVWQGTGMIPIARDDQKKEAFRLFEDGRYQESLKVCQILLDTEKDPAIEVLAATNLFLAGRLEDAEAAFLDLARKMPDSSYVHSYLAKVLEARGDEGAIAEYATAVHLDPTNQDALRSYAGYLLGRRDYRGALRVLRRLVQLGRKPGDVRNLMRALIEVGEADEALATHTVLGEGVDKSHEYIDALGKTENYQAAAEAACEIYRKTRDPCGTEKISRSTLPV